MPLPVANAARTPPARALPGTTARRPAPRRHVSPACALLCTVALVATAPAAAVEVEARTSPGGIDFLHAPLPDTDLVSVQVAWPSAWSYTEDAVAAPFVGGDLMLTGGAGELGAAELQQAFEDLRVDGTIAVQPDHVYGTLNVAPANLDAALDLAADVLVDPALDERWFERIRDGFASNVAEAKRATGTRVHDALARLVFGDVPLERTLTMEPASLAGAVTLEDVRRWHERTFTRAGATVVVAGDVGTEAAGEAVDRLLGELPAGDAPAPPPEVDADFSARTVLLHAPDSEISAVALLGRLPPTADGDEIEDLVAVLALGAGEGSRLYEAIRTELRATYDVQALLDSQTRALRGLLLYTEVDPAKLDAARRALRDAYAAFRAEGPTEAEIAGGKRRIAEGLGRTFASPGPLGRSVLESALDGYGPERVPAMLEKEVGGASAKSVTKRLASGWPEVGSMIEVVVSPDAGAVEGACTVESLEELEGC